MSTYLADRRTHGMPDPSEVVSATVASHTGRFGRRTLAHVEWTIAQLALRHPGARLVIIQGCYHAGYAPSAGTHDEDGVLDAEVIGLSWPDAQRFLRECGWAAWWRHTGEWTAESAWHVHMVSLGCPGPVGIYVPAQVDDYYRHALGLKGQHDSGDDPTWHPAEIDSTVFDYPAYLAAQEDAMPYTDWPQADRDALAADVAAAVLDAAKVDKEKKVSVRQALNQIRNKVAAK